MLLHKFSKNFIYLSKNLVSTFYTKACQNGSHFKMIYSCVCVKKNVFCDSLKRFKMEVDVAIKINYLYCTHLRRKIIRFYDIIYFAWHAKELFHRQININLFQYFKLMTIWSKTKRNKKLSKTKFFIPSFTAHTFD